ncbi:MFS transporter [Haladaptatus paucihalophilus]|uniref:Predicted arabinose efflux permease, MFS family n=1 Tax=Haladaptatus paucihalophilus DX253 TaxID=797209 RepID=A0A1M6NU57_HALPU|nr:MFS transporter [Haladaptatus paucihalophilus]SHJ99235.1 Predicted arabinose efflux permease, MFS family [Haladaptatus paucihalophilus DX253]
MSFRSSLKNRGFLSLWLAQVVSRIGDSIHEIALIWVVYEVTENPVLMSAVVVASLGPSVLFSLPAGSLVDRLNRKYILIGTDLIRGAAVLLIPLIGSRQLLVPVVLFVAAISGLMESFAGPARSSLIPRLVPNTELDSANALQQMTTSASQTLYVIGGIIVGVTGSFSAFYLDSASFFLSAIILLPISRQAGTPDRSSNNSTGLLAEARDAIDFIRQHRILPSVIILSALTGFALGPLAIVLPLFTENILGHGSTAFGILYGSLYAGVLIGGTIVGGVNTRLSSYRGIIMTGGTLLTGLSLILVAIIPSQVSFSLVAAIILFAFCGVAISLIQVPLQTLVQSAVPDERRGRVFSVMTAAGLAAPPVSVALTGPLLAQFGVINLLLIEGIFVSLSGIIIALTPLAHVGENDSARSDLLNN